MAQWKTNQSRKLDEEIARKKSVLASLKQQIDEAKRSLKDESLPGEQKSSPISQEDGSGPLQIYAADLERENDVLKDSIIDMRTERDAVLRALSEVVKDATRFGYFVKEEVGDIESTATNSLGPIAGRLKFFLDAMPRALADAGIAAPELVGLEYEPGLTVEALNLDEFGANDKLVIVDVVEPLLTYTPRNVDVSDESERIRLRIGKVLVAKKEK